MQIKLQEQPFQVLIALLARPGEMVTREELRASFGRRMHSLILTTG